jgi:CubicO group peptidase (beta-lactamase class C family)
MMQMSKRKIPGMFQRTAVVFIFLAITVAASAVYADIATVDPGSIGLNPGKLEEVRQALQKDIADGKVPGAVMLIARKGQVGFYEAAGKQGPNDEKPMTSKTIFRIYSMTKPIVSVAAMTLVEEGRLRLEEPLSTYIPFFAASKVHEFGDKTSPASNPITILDLMRHTSGLIYGVFDPKGTVGKMYIEAGIASRDNSLNEFAARLGSLPLRFEPGTAWHYSRSTDVLGRVLEIASGQTLDKFLDERVLKPLGMVDTAFFQTPDKADRFAQPVKELFDMLDAKPFLSAGGGLTSTMEDYFRFAMMLRNRGSLDGVRIIKPETLALMTRNHIADGVDRRFFYPGQAYGFGLGFAVRITDEGARYPGTLGDYWWRGLAGTYFWIDPRKDLFAIFMIQDPANRVHYTGTTRNWVYSTLAD